jgi:hypothetical protein
MEGHVGLRDRCSDTSVTLSDFRHLTACEFLELSECPGLRECLGMSECLD